MEAFLQHKICPTWLIYLHKIILTAHAQEFWAIALSGIQWCKERKDFVAYSGEVSELR